MDSGKRINSSGYACLSDERQRGVDSRGEVQIVVPALGPAIRLRAKQPVNRPCQQLWIDGRQRAIGPQCHPGYPIAQRLQQKPVDDLRCFEEGVTFEAGVSVLSGQHPGQFAQLFGDTASETMVWESQPMRGFRLRGQIVVAQVGISPKLEARRLSKWINFLHYTSLRRRCRVAVDDARIERAFSDDRHRAIRRGAAVEA